MKSSEQIPAMQAIPVEAAKWLAVALDSINLGVITTDIAGGIVSINPAASRLTGWPPAEAEGRLLMEILVIVNKENGQPCADWMPEVLQAGKTVDLPERMRLISRKKNEHTISGSAAPMYDSARGIIGMVLAFRDVTERRRSDEELLLQSKLESGALLAGGIAHDFNNILLGIIGNVSLARMTSHSTEKVLERLAGVEKAALRAKDLTQQLLSFAKGGAVAKKTMPVNGMLREVCDSALQDADVQCEFSLREDAWPVEVDEGQFRQVLNSLILNARQATPDSGRMEVRLDNVELSRGFPPNLPAGKYLKISIKDSGPGIAPENVARIFEPYFSTKTHRSGLGLATAYSVVRKHGGYIGVESAVGAGTTFHIYLPASNQTATAAPDRQAQAGFFGQGRVLVMEDEPDILIIVCEMLKSFGYEVETAKDGEEAIQHFRNAFKAGRPFDAVILDLTVPNGMG
ncbi:MAG TPA: ATP-binding protein, partial [Verrucomicrobiae bacterium]|nr:ATP-binding protein [Verrucomicrobiae bacterium]